MNLQQLTFTGKVEQLFIGEQREAGIAKKPTNKVKCMAGGIEGDCHARLTYASGGREKSITPKGTEIRNLREVSIASTEEVKSTFEDMDITGFHAGDLGVNILLSGIPNFTQLVAGTVLKFSNGVQLYITMQNTPCAIPAKALRDNLPEQQKDNANGFVAAARGRRGQLAFILREGIIQENETVEVWQQTYEPAAINEQ